MCHHNTSIPEHHKFYYLKACLKSEAAGVMASLEITEDNYKVAWDSLKKRYDNRRVIVDSHVKSIFEISINSKDTLIRSHLTIYKKEEERLTQCSNRKRK